MVGVKRRIESNEGDRGKRTKVKNVPPTTRKSTSNSTASATYLESGAINKRLQVKQATKSGGYRKQKEKDREIDGEEEDEMSLDEDSKDPMETQAVGGHIKTFSMKTKGSSEAVKRTNGCADAGTDSLSSRESHAQQKAVAQQRKAAKPNADSIARSKKLWERLRRKSHVPREERKQLVSELYGIVTGRVKEFVFKHDSVRVIQTALKYASLEQRNQIARELKGSYKALAESRYAKFLIGKILVHGDGDIRDMIIPEFYGSVRRLIKHPEAAWILDDIYRAVATGEQKLNLLQEWYGSEFALFKAHNGSSPPSDLCQILTEHPEKRGPIMNDLYELINQLVQKKFTGFTMLHDAMLQYFLNTKPDSSEASELIELVKGDEEGDLAKNMVFTKSGSRLICLFLAHSSAKDRKLLLRPYRDTIKMMAADTYGHAVILTALEVIDDTKLASKSIFPELLGQTLTETERNKELLRQVDDLTARIPILHLFAGDGVRWLHSGLDREILREVWGIRKSTSKKDPSIRRQELIKTASPSLLEFIADSAGSLMETSSGCQFVTEVLFEADGDKSIALAAVAIAAKSKSEVQDSISVGRMLKSLVQGGRFDNKNKVIQKVEPPLKFHSLLYENIKDDVMTWATGVRSFVIVALVESDDFDKEELLQTLKENKQVLEQAVTAGIESSEGERKKSTPVVSGAKLLLQRLR